MGGGGGGRRGTRKLRKSKQASYRHLNPVPLTHRITDTVGAIGSLKNAKGYVGVIGYQWYTNGIIQYTPLVESET